MGWIIILAILVILGYVMVLMSVTMPRFKLMQKLVDKINLVSREILTGLSVIRAFGRETEEEKRFDAANKDLTKTMLFTNRVMTFMMPGMMLIMNLLTVGIVWVGAHKIDAGSMQVGSMTAFITYAMMIVMAFLMLTAMSIMLPRAAVAAERIDEVIRTESSIEDAKNPEELREHKGVIRFSHVSFRYPGAEADVLEDIDFTAEPGKTTAIIGSTGCGKSTLVNLVCRFYEPTAGKILIDGCDVRDRAQIWLHSQIGYVLQTPHLFSGSVAENLRYGNTEATEEEMWQALHLISADKVVERMGQGLQSDVGEGGDSLSTGEKQLLSFARVLLADPRIFVLDEATSSVDSETERLIQNATETVMRGRTSFVIAHRLSTIRNADVILAVRGGKIVESGTHDALMAQKGYYYTLYTRQFEDEQTKKTLDNA